MNNKISEIYDKEEKVSEGIYITKPEKKEVIENKKEQKYVFKSTAELINILENDFESIAGQIKMLYDANEEMLEYDPTDLDLLDAREENLEIINKKIIRMKEIQLELKKYCPTNPLVTTDVFDYFLDNKAENKVAINKIEVVGNVIENIDLTDIESSDIVTEIEL